MHKKNHLDLYERCLLSLFLAYITTTILAPLTGLHWLTLFTTLGVTCSCAVLFLDRLHVSPSNKAVLITGCDTGFGLAAAARLHGMGYTVFAGVLSTETEGSKKLSKLEQRMFLVPMDVRSDEEVRSGLGFVRKNLNGLKLWAVITNAGWSTFGDLELVPLPIYQKIMDINLFGSIRVIKASLPLLREARGRIITISSMMGRFGAPGRSPYCSTKWAVEGLSECLRAEMKRWGVKVCVVEPGNFIAGTALYANDAIQSQATVLWDNMDDQLKKTYNKTDFDAQIKKMIHYTKTGVADIDPVVQAYCDAVSHTYPHPRYQIMSLEEKLKCFICTHAPSFIYDALY